MNTLNKALGPSSVPDKYKNILKKEISNSVVSFGSVFCTDNFIKGIDDNWMSIRSGKAEEKFFFIFVNQLKDSSNGVLNGQPNVLDTGQGRPCVNEWRVNSPNTTELKSGLAVRILYFKYNNDLILTNFYIHTGENIQKSNYKNCEEQIKNIVDNKCVFANTETNQESTTENLFNKVITYLNNKIKNINIVSSCIKDYFNANPEIKNLYEIKYKLDGIIDLDVDGLKDVGVDDADINYEISRILNEKYYLKLQEGYITEANRQQLLQKSRNAQHYKDISKGKNRYERRTKSSISATIKDYNSINMDDLFKKDVLKIKIPVMGETDVYEVEINAEGFLAEVHKQILANKGKLEFKVIFQSLMNTLNSGNVFISCDCSDSRYRMAYWQTKNGYKSGEPELRPSDITNPKDSMGAACKHTLLVLSNLEWTMKVSSVLNNYIKYCKEHLGNLYTKFIFPKLYGINYDKAIDLGVYEDGVLPSDAETMKKITQKALQGRTNQGKFTTDNPFKFQKKNLTKMTDDDKMIVNEPVEKELKVEEEPK